MACPAGVEPATYGLEGLSNLRNTMVDNGLQCPDLGVRQNTGLAGIEWGLVLVVMVSAGVCWENRHIN